MILLTVSYIPSLYNIKINMDYPTEEDFLEPDDYDLYEKQFEDEFEMMENIFEDKNKSMYQLSTIQCLINVTL